MTQMNILGWRPFRKNSLLGFAEVELHSGMIVSDVTIHSSDRGAWASPPAKPMIGADGVPMKDGAGKARFVPIIEFKSKEVRDRFSSGVIEALRAAHPGAVP